MDKTVGFFMHFFFILFESNAIQFRYSSIDLDYKAIDRVCHFLTKMNTFSVSRFSSWKCIVCHLNSFLSLSYGWIKKHNLFDMKYVQLPTIRRLPKCFFMFSMQGPMLSDLLTRNTKNCKLNILKKVIFSFHHDSFRSES